MSQSKNKRLRKIAQKIHQTEEGSIAEEKFILKALKKEYKRRAPSDRAAFLNLLEIS